MTGRTEQQALAVSFPVVVEGEAKLVTLSRRSYPGTDFRADLRRGSLFVGRLGAHSTHLGAWGERFYALHPLRGPWEFVCAPPLAWDGPSFQLAAAVAALRAEYGQPAGADSVCATGELGHGGAILPVAAAGFCAKLDAVLDAQSRPVLFLYPKDQPLDEEAQRLLAEMREQGIEVRPVDHLAALSGLWGRTRRTLPAARPAVVSLALALIAGVLWVNRDAPVEWPARLPPAPPAAGPAGLTTVYNAPDSASAQAGDLDIAFRYSGPGHNGKSFPLSDGATLKSGDEYTLTVRSRADLHLYVYHFDGHGYLKELVSAEGHDNHLRPGQRLALPAEARHYALDHNTGDEVFHFLVAPGPLGDLHARYRQQLIAGERELLAVAKGAVVAPDIAPAAATGAPDPAVRVRQVRCPAAEACRESFHIRHVAR